MLYIFFTKPFVILQIFSSEYDTFFHTFLSACLELLFQRREKSEILLAKKNNILVGPGRGSGAASLVNYSLGIINVDPLKYDADMMEYINYLSNSNENLILNLKELINYIKLLDLELQDYIGQNSEEEE